MNRLTMLMTATALTLTYSIVGAQSKTVPMKMEKVTATVQAIDPGARQVTVKKADGTFDVWYVPPTVKRFETLKIGSRITATQYENMVLRVQQPGQQDVDKTARGVVTSGAGDAAGGTLAHQRTITATISMIDMKTPSVTFTGPNGFTFHTKVKDKDALSKVKVGDKVDITWTEATLVSIDDVG